MVPFARELVRSGVTVVIAANEIAAINDVTASELKVRPAPATCICAPPLFPHAWDWSGLVCLNIIQIAQLTSAM